jgi:hypothetical protein
MTCGVVCTLRMVEAALTPPLKVIELEVALQDPAGGAVQVTETGFPNTEIGLKVAVYCATWPAGVVWPEGLTFREKAPAVNEAIAGVMPLVFELLISIT